MGTPYAEIAEEQIEWLWHRYIARGKVHIVEGDPGTGKSSVSADLAARLSTGASWPDGTRGGKPGVTLICTVEDGAGDTVRPRLRHAGADLSRVLHVHDGAMDPLFHLPDDLSKLAALISTRRHWSSSTR